jgi:tRNA(Ile)-lysidine synthase TilS/MesJ
MMQGSQRICKICVLDDNFPGIKFDSEGVCNLCRSIGKPVHQAEKKHEYEAKFRDLISQHKGKSEYDALVAFSGGKDSAYTLDLVKNRFGLHPLSYSYDNGFQSERALDNIRSVVAHLGVDHITLAPDPEIFSAIIRAAVNSDLYSPKTLERASSICTTCLSLIRFSGLRIAIERQIPFLIFGLSPGQAPIRTSIFKSNPEMIRKMQDAIFKPLYHKLGDVINPYFLEDLHFKNRVDFPYLINPLAFSEYDEEMIKEKITGYGWIKPDDTDPNSTNCLLNALANQLHRDRFGFNPYAAEVADLVRRGLMDREEGLRRLSGVDAQEKERMKSIKGKLGL